MDPNWQLLSQHGDGLSFLQPASTSWKKNKPEDLKTSCISKGLSNFSTYIRFSETGKVRSTSTSKQQFWLQTWPHVHVQNITTTHTELVLIFLFFVLAQNQMEMVNERTVPLAITKHQWSLLTSWVLPSSFILVGVTPPGASALHGNFYSLSSYLDQLHLSVWPKPPLWTTEMFRPDSVKYLWKIQWTFFVKRHIPSAYSQYLFFITEDFLRNLGHFRAREEGRRITSKISPVCSSKQGHFPVITSAPNSSSP